MPEALFAGISYSDYWLMTVGEITQVIERAAKRETEEIKTRAALAYKTGVTARTDTRLPRTCAAAFPSLFGYAGDGQILADNLEESERAMGAWFQRFNRKAANK